MKQLWELAGQQHSIRAIARELHLSRNTVRKHLRAPGMPRHSPRPVRPSKLDAYRDHIRDRLAAGGENAVVLLRELRAQGYTGSHTILKAYVQPLRLAAPFCPSQMWVLKKRFWLRMHLGQENSTKHHYGESEVTAL